MKYINLTRGAVAIVDDEDYEYLNQWGWYAFKGTRTLYAARKERDGLGYRTVFMHRSITSAPIGMEVDHVDGNGLNNTKNNLRVCTRTQNARNSRIRSDNTSGYKGVCFDKKNKRFMAKIEVDQTYINIGRFDTPEEAAHAYDEAAKKHFGEYARTNFK